MSSLCRCVPRLLAASAFRSSCSAWPRFASTDPVNGESSEKPEEKEHVHPDQEKEPLKPHPGGINPLTGERGGPAGPEPTRYGDWERKGRVYDF